MSVNLFPKQRLALAWMRGQEAGKHVVLESAEEARLPCLGWCVEMRAQTTQKVRGGICADHPGFGKTITSLALVHSEWQQKGSNAIKAEVKASEDSDNKAAFLTSSATLIVCPKLLIDQWFNEAA